MDTKETGASAAAVKTRPKRGRPPLRYEDAGLQAAYVLKVANAQQRGPSAIASLGLTESEAARILRKRYRGVIGQLLGDSLAGYRTGPSPTGRAVELILDAGFSITAAVAFTKKADRSNVRRALGREWDRRSLAIIRRAVRPVDVWEANFLPPNTLHKKV